MRYAIWGAGKIGQSAYHAMTNKGHEIVCFIDNNDKLWGTHLKGIKIYSFSEFQVLENNCVILIACAAKNVQPIINYIKEENCEIKFEVFNTRYIYERERLISYSHPSDLEDIILYNIFKEEKNITYIDVGANDPEIYSVTKLLYDKLGARGINIEPLPEAYKMLCSNRPDDINLNVGVDKKMDD